MFSRLKGRKANTDVPLCQNKPPAEMLIRSDVTLTFGGSTYTGDLRYAPASAELTLVNTENEQETHIYLSTSLKPNHRAPGTRCVYIKDWAEDAGLTRALLEQGLVQLRGRYVWTSADTILCEVQIVV